MSIQKKNPRPYKRITPKTVADFTIQETLHGNGSQAVRQMEDTRLSPGSRAFRIREKQKEMATSQFIDEQLQQIGVDAINRIGKLVNSEDESIAMRSSSYVVDHIRGQATKKSVTLTGKVNIQSVLD
jgi:hypothetical protein